MGLMPQKKEFYFLRHGQTDYNLRSVEKIDHPPHIPLNETGRKQALTIEPIIAKLPIQTICYSPMLRAVQTKEIIASHLTVPQYEIADLGECTARVWHAMPELQSQPIQSSNTLVLEFLERVLRGLETALSYSGPVLIVAHGGVHWALCSLLRIADHEWFTDNCVPIHFYLENGEWKANTICQK
jgi:probable phosphoglycerate mutase